MAIGKLSTRHREFIEKQNLFFVATADTDGRVNVSPKGMDTLRILDENRLIWLSLSGSGNETAAHVAATKRMTMMFCAFEGEALILRLYGKAKVFHPRDPEWSDLLAYFPSLAGSRQVFELEIDLVQASCGTGVPVMEYKRSRGETELEPFFEELGPEGVRKFWEKKNKKTIDGKITGIGE